MRKILQIKSLHMRLLHIVFVCSAASCPIYPSYHRGMYENLRLGRSFVCSHALRPDGDNRLIDEDLERRMDVIRSFDEAVANARQAGRRRSSLAGQRVIVVTSSESVTEAFHSMEELAKRGLMPGVLR